MSASQDLFRQAFQYYVDSFVLKHFIFLETIAKFFVITFKESCEDGLV